MHRLHRDSVVVPQCLVQPSGQYCDLGRKEREEIRRALLVIQGQRCAYCERRTGADQNDGHIEHFRKQAEHAHLELAWHNLFWSCKDEQTCGKYKDKCTKSSGEMRFFDTNDIIDPAKEDPERFLLFVLDGTVLPREELSDAERRRAKETLRIFQLDRSAFLRKSRQDAVKPYLNFVEEMIKLPRDHFLQCVKKILEKIDIDSEPFATPIKCFLESLIKP